MNYKVLVANQSHHRFATDICSLIEAASKERGTGIAKRNPEYIREKMDEGKAIIAFYGEMSIGFCYIESWEGKKYVANSGLVVHPDYRKTGLAKEIKKATFELSKKLFPDAKLFGITTSLAVMKINSSLGYTPVTFSELTKDESFWKGCSSCKNYDILNRTNKTMCLCTGMVCDLSKVEKTGPVKDSYKAWEGYKRFLELRKIRIKRIVNRFPFLQRAVNALTPLNNEKSIK